MEQQYYYEFLKDNETYLDLSFYFCGKEECKPGYSWRPCIRDHYVIHYIQDGKGVFQSGNDIYSLNKGNGFLIYPNVSTTYKADETNPWTYFWIGFNGFKVDSYLERAGLSLNDPIFFYNRDEALTECLEKIIKENKFSETIDILMTYLLYEFFYLLISKSDSKIHTDKNAVSNKVYIKKIVEYIHMNYSRKINIAELAKYLGINRQYLFLIFKKAIHQSPQQYLINYRMKKACELIAQNVMSVSDISYSVGYNDPLCFSRIFKKMKGISPSDYRKSIEEQKE